MAAGQLRLVTADDSADVAPESAGALPAPARQFTLFAADQQDGAEAVASDPQTAQLIENGASVPRIMHPGYAPDWSAIAAAEVLRVEIPEDQRAGYAESVTLRQFYADPAYGLAASRRDRVAAGTLARSSTAKDRQALNRWEQYSPRPPEWPIGETWQGRPLAWITDQHCTDTVSAMRRGLALQTCRSTWNHLRTILNWAVQVKALERAPEPAWPKSDGADRQPHGLYDDRQLAAIYGALSDCDYVDLQVAFVVSVNVGPRTVDLFTLRWDNVLLDRDRPVCEFTARKTGKRQTVPLAEVTVRQLERWRRASGVLMRRGLIWPQLSDAGAADPEESRAAKRRNARFKRVLRSLGIEYERPWQVGRLTCNERLERHRPGSGRFVIGHERTLNTTSYREPSGLIYEAVTTLPQPECFQSE